MADGEAAHAKFSPSGSDKWIKCPGSLALEQDYPNDSSDFADEGTAAHELASHVLERGAALCTDYLGLRLELRPGKTWEVDAEMCDEVQKYVDFVRAVEATGSALLIEQRVCFEKALGLDPGEGWGTSDVIAIGDRHLTVIDLKYGRGVRVVADNNSQMKCYALGALETFGDLIGQVDRVTLVIHQPRIVGGVTIWETTPAELQAFAREAATAAVDVKAAIRAKVDGEVPSKLLNPGDKQCRWCRAKATCPALGRSVQEIIGAQFEDLTKELPDPERIYPGPEIGDNYLAAAMGAADMIESWLKAVRAETERRLIAGRKVTGWKLVEGRKGARAWSDPKAAEKLLKESFRLPVDDIYDKTLISAPTAVKLLKDQPKRLEKVQALITQKAGKPSVAPADDPGKEWAPMAFEDESTKEFA